MTDVDIISQMMNLKHVQMKMQK